MRCAKCAHYQTGERTRTLCVPPDGYGHCGRWHQGYSVEMREVSSNEVLVEDDEGWGNIVGPEFGCVLFEQIKQ